MQIFSLQIETTAKNGLSQYSLAAWEKYAEIYRKAYFSYYLNKKKKKKRRKKLQSSKNKLLCTLNVSILIQIPMNTLSLRSFPKQMNELIRWMSLKIILKIIVNIQVPSSILKYP